MNGRVVGVVAILSILLLGSFARLASHPSSLIVDADHPSVDHARPLDDPANGNDLTQLFLPHHLAIARSLARLGRVPLWDDRGFAGRPLVGNPQAGLFYPPVWVVWWSGSAGALGWVTVAHLLGMGLGTYRLSRTLGMGVWGSIIAAGCVQVSPYVLAQTFEGHYPHVWSASWYPWAFDATVKLRRGDWVSGLWLVPILGATFLAGHPQEGYYLLIALGLWAVYDEIAAIRARQIRWALTFGGSWVVILFLTFGLIGIEVIPDAMAQEWTLRGAKLTMRLAGRYHVYPLNLLQLLSPQALGGPADYFGHENYWESVVSIGLIPLGLVAIGLAWSPDRRLSRGLLILVVGSLLFASGRKLGVFPVLFEIVPGMNRFRVPARSLFLTSLGASLLAGQGVEALLARAGGKEGWGKLARRAVVFAGLLASLVLLGSLNRTPVPSEPGELDRLKVGISRLAADRSFWLSLGVMPIGLVLAWKVPRARRRLAVALGLLGLVELGYQGHRLIVTTTASRYLGGDPISRALTETRPEGLAPTRIRVVDALYDDLRAERLGLTKTNVNDSFQIQHGADLHETLYHLFDAHKFVGTAPMDHEVARYRRLIRQSVLDRMSVAFLVDDRLDPETHWPRLASGTWQGSTYVVYRNPTCLPRAYVVPRAEVATDDRFFLDRFRRVAPQGAVLMETDPIGPSPPVRQPFTPADWTSTDPDRLVLKVETEAPGLLVVTETWMPGWVATVNGKAAPLLRGNHAQRVVPLFKPGRHEVVLTYRTPGLTAGLALTLGSAAVWLLLLFRVVRKA